MAKYKAPKEKFDRTASDPRRAAFERLFERRIEAIKEDARLLANLSNPYNYSYGPEDIQKLRREMNEMTRTTVDAFENRIPGLNALQKKRVRS